MHYLSGRARRFNRAFLCVLAVVFLLTLLKGIRLPNLYSAAHLALNYSQGFVRRGFLGELSRHVFGDLTFKYWFFVGWSFTILALIALALALIVRRVIRAEPREFGFKAAMLAFAASPGLVMFVHTVGYFDHIGFLATLCLLLWMPRARFRLLPFYVVVAVGCLLALVHEILIPMFGPVLFLAMLCHVVRQAPQQSFGMRATMGAHAVGAMLLVLVISTLASAVGVEDRARVIALQQFIAERVDYGLRPDLFEALYRSSERNLNWLMPAYWRIDPPWPLVQKSFLSILPSYAYLILYGVYTIVRYPFSKGLRTLIGLTFVGACLAPLTLNAVGWDWNRWNGIAVLASFSSVVTLKLFLYSPRRRSSLLVPILGVIATAIGLASDTVLFDNAKVQFFPFEQHERLLDRLLQREPRFRPRF
ncbi:MAG TPA: hypothetical protein VIM73_22635 [Polyangiaceae bacterium]